MLREFARIVALALLVAGLFVPGCVDEKEFTKARFECIDLTSQAYARVPECDSQEECFSKLEKGLFSFSDEELAYETRQKLFEYKNHVARSWLYYNRALKRVEGIRSVCLSGKGFERLAGLSNELNHFLLVSFDEADKADIESLSILALEAKRLEGDDVYRIREEELFDVFVKVNNNLNSLSPESTIHSTYYGKILAKVKEFNKMSQEKGFVEIVLAQFGLDDLVLPFFDAAASSFVKKNRERAFFLPLLGRAFSSFLSAFESSADLEQSLSLLRGSPAFEFLGIYSDFLGERDSVLAEFSALLKQDCLSRRFLEHESTGLEDSIREKISSAREKIDSIPMQEFTYVDSNFFSSLYMLSGEKTRLAYREFDFESLREAWRKSNTELEKAELDFQSLVSEKDAGMISIGSRAAGLKRINSKLDELIASLDYVKDSLIGGIDAECKKAIPLIESKMKTINAGVSPSLLYYKSAVDNKLSYFKRATSPSERIYYCHEALLSLNSLEQAVADDRNVRRNVRAELGSCLDSLDGLLPALADSPGLSETIQGFKERVSFGEFDASYKETCESLLSMAEGSIREEFGVSGIEESFSDSIDLLEKLSLLTDSIPSAKNSSSTVSLKKEASELSGFFKDSKLDLTRAVDRLPSLSWRVSELKRKLAEKTSGLLSDYVSERAVTVSVPVDEAVLGKEFKSIKRVEFFNPFFDWSLPLSAQVRLAQCLDGIKAKSGNVSDFTVKGKNALVEFSSLPRGTSFIEVFSRSVVPFSESERIVQLSEEYAEVEKKIVFKGSSVVSRLRVEAPLSSPDLNAFGLRAVHAGTSIPVFLNSGNATLLVENAKPEQSLFIYYKLSGPLLLEKHLLSSTRIDENSSLQEYRFTAENRLSFSLSKFKAVFPFPHARERIEKIEVADSMEGEKKAFLKENSIVVEAGSLLPGQRKDFTALVWVKDDAVFFSRLVRETEQKLQTLSFSENTEIARKARSYIPELNALGDLNFEKNKKKASELFDRVVSLEKSASLDSQLGLEIGFLKKQAEEKISAFKRQLSKAKELGFSDYARSLTVAISNAGEKLAGAESAKNSDKQKAFLLLQQANSELAGFDSKKALAGIEDQAEASFGGVSSAIQRLESLNLKPPSLALLREQAVKSRDALEKSISGNDLLGAKQELDNLTGLSAKAKTLFVAETEREAAKIMELANSAMEACASARAGLSALKGELVSVQPKQLVSARIMLPLGDNDLQKVERELEENCSTNTGLFKELGALAGSGKNAEIIARANGTDFEAVRKKASKTTRLVNSLNNAIKSEALSSLSRAREKLGGLDKEGIGLLEESVSEARRNNYLKSLVLSRAALASMERQPGADWSVLLFPLFVVLSIAFVRAYKKTKRGPTKFYKRIPRHF